MCSPPRGCQTSNRRIFTPHCVRPTQRKTVRAVGSGRCGRGRPEAQSRALLARRFRHRGESFEDLKQVAQLGLIKAVTRFDPSFGTAFPSVAIPTILGEVKRHFRDHLWGVMCRDA
ncbi:sigma factor [Streptomyces sp. NPDC058678]|uniref:sigma factor n=1 Tax=Streptomyces sp. NPDC058678 TaxID=3346595 RepID=UPI00365BCB07